MARTICWLLAFAPACVIVDDPNHCWNLDRDATCEQLYPGSVCSRCARGYSGCVDVEDDVPAACLDDREASSTSGDATASTEAASTGALECSGDGVVEACPSEQPYCVDGGCSSCASAGGDMFCAAVSSELPQCHPNTGQCVECYDDTPCAGRFCTTGFECGGCNDHSQCPDSACDLLTGSCMVLDLEIWVDDDDAICDEGSSGASAANPVCSVVEAFTRVSPGHSAIIHVADGSYDGVEVATSCSGRHIAVLGNGTATVLHDGDASIPPLRVACDDAVYLRGVRLHANSEHALLCEGNATVWIDQSIVEAGHPGMRADSCDVSVSRTHVRDNDTHAIELYEGSSLSMWSSIVSGTKQAGAPTGAVVVASSQADIRASTLVANAGHDVICSGSSGGTVSDSLLASDATTEPAVCQSMVFDHSVIGASDVDGSDNSALTYRSQWFRDVEAGDFRLGEGAAELADIARWDAGDPRYDYEADPWPDVPGTPSYAGADQP